MEAKQVLDVVYESDGGGSAQGLRIRVRGDGLIEHTRVGHPRQGTEDETRVAQATPQEVEGLVDTLRASGFVLLPPVIDSEHTADGAWAQVRVRWLPSAAPHTPAAQQEHQVWWRDGLAPPALQAVEARMRALGDRAVSPDKPR